MTSLSDNQLIDSFNWRYATKVFDADKKISSESLAALEEALRLTPSSFGLQPWHFLSITSDSVRAELLPNSWGQKQVTDCSHYFVLCTRTDINEAFVAEFIASTAEQREVSIESLQGYHDVVVGFISQMNTDERLEWSKRQTYLALQRLVDSAALLGIDTCPIEGFLPAEYDKTLDLSRKNLASTVCCAVGYRSNEDKYAELPKSRYPREKIITHIE